MNKKIYIIYTKNQRTFFVHTPSMRFGRAQRFSLSHKYCIQLQHHSINKMTAHVRETHTYNFT